MAHTKAGGSTKLGRDSASQRLGVKLYAGQAVKAGSILARQRGSRMEPGPGAAIGVDHTIFATRPGKVAFSVKRIAKFTGRKIRRTFISVTD